MHFYSIGNPGFLRRLRAPVLSLVDLLAGVRLYFQMRSVYRLPRNRDTSDKQNYALYEVPRATATCLRPACRELGVTRHQLFLTALVQILAEMTPTRRHQRNRRSLAVCSIVDLRSGLSADVANSFGLYLAPAVMVIAQPDVPRPETLLKDITLRSRKDGNTRYNLLPEWNIRILNHMKASSSRKDAFLWYRKVFPISGGLSTVYLTRDFFGAAGNRILDYFRVSPIGPAVPLLLTPTCLDDSLNFSLGYRETMLKPDRAQEFGERFIKALERLVAVRSTELWKE
jgi:hypothetical protein